jgi:hypothetical protein
VGAIAETAASGGATGTGQILGLPTDADGNFYFELDGSGRPFEVRIDIPAGEYEELYFDGALWTPGADYAVRSGSTVLTITADKLAGFPYGTHELAARFTENRVITVVFDLRGPAAADQAAGVLPLSASVSDETAPADYAPVVAAGILSLAAFAAWTRMRRRAAR